jgi:hypothetical protein
MDRMGIFRALQGERFAFRYPAVLSDGVNQLGQSELAIRSAFRTPSFTILPSRSIVFFPGGGSSTPTTSFLEGSPKRGVWMLWTPPAGPAGSATLAASVRKALRINFGRRPQDARF